MTRRLAGALAAGAFAVGILAGSAGTILAGDARTSRTDCGAVTAHHTGGDGMSSMMTMISSSMMGPDASWMPMDPADHIAHHGPSSSEPSK